MDNKNILGRPERIFIITNKLNVIYNHWNIFLAIMSKAILIPNRYHNIAFSIKKMSAMFVLADRNLTGVVTWCGRRLTGIENNTPKMRHIFKVVIMKLLLFQTMLYYIMVWDWFFLFLLSIYLNGSCLAVILHTLLNSKFLRTSNWCLPFASTKLWQSFWIWI